VKKYHSKSHRGIYFFQYHRSFFQQILPNFARSRLAQQSEKRKILMVISDGTPVDDSTTCNNDGDILSDHLRHVINMIEKRGKIEIIGVGIGHATDEFYKNSITIRALEDLGDVMIDKIINVL